MELLLFIVLLTSTTISVLIWLVQRIAFQSARKWGLLAVFLAQLTLSTLILSGLIFEFNRALNANEVDGPVGFGMGIFIALLGYTLILSILFNVMSAIAICWRHR